MHKPGKASGGLCLQGLLIRAGKCFPLLDDDPVAKLTLMLKAMKLTEGAGESAVGRSWMRALAPPKSGLFWFSLFFTSCTSLSHSIN